MKRKVIAKLEIKEGDQCIVRSPGYMDQDPDDFRVVCDGQKAEIIRTYPGKDTADIRMITGRWAGKVLENIYTGILEFSDGFCRADDCGTT